MWDLLSTNIKKFSTKDTCLCFCSYDLIGLEGLSQALCIFIGKDGVPNYKFLHLPINSILKMHVNLEVRRCISKILNKKCDPSYSLIIVLWW